MSAQEPFGLTATEALDRIETGQLSPVEWVGSCLERIAAREPEIRAWAHVDQTSVETAKVRWDTARQISIPVGAKDIIDVAGMPTRLGTSFASDQPVLREGGSVSLLREAGCLFIGKTVTTELGHRHPGPTRNPHNPRHTPGGSSSGSAAAVADCMVPMALGTQTSGSVIRPAAYCGVVGYKPTYGDFDKTGILANAPSMDTLGLLARSVEDIELFRSFLLNRSPKPLPRPDMSDLRLALLTAPPWDTADDETRQHLETFVAAASASGAHVDTVELDDQVQRLLELHRLISGYEFKRSVAFERIHHYSDLSAILREGRLADGDEVSPQAYQSMLLEVAQLRRELTETFKHCDILVAPSAATAAPASLEATGDAGFNSAWTLTGHPAVSLPMFSSAQSGLPIGCQLIGAFADDDRLLAAAATISAHRKL